MSTLGPKDFERARDPELAAPTAPPAEVEREVQEIPSPVRFDDDVMDFRVNTNEGDVEKDFSPKVESAPAPASGLTSQQKTTPVTGLEDVTEEDLQPQTNPLSPAPASVGSDKVTTSLDESGTATSSSTPVTTI